MNIIFSTPWADIESECDTKYPTYDEERATKSLLFNRFQGAGRTPVRFLTFTGDASMYNLLVDVPTVSSLDQIDSEVLPFTCAVP